MATGEQLVNMDQHRGFIRAVVTHPHEAVCASSGDDTVVYIWNIDTGKVPPSSSVAPLALTIVSIARSCARSQSILSQSLGSSSLLAESGW